MNYIEIKAPAKINIGLNIVEKRSDGFHNLETFFYPINDLYDELTFERSDNFVFVCDSKEIDSLADNLVVKAKNLLENETKKILDVKISLKKNIPLGAGLGGGSSDAAATLISLNEMYELNISYKRLSELALQLGSDVPFFLKAKPSVGKSRGEILTIKDFEIPFPILIVNPRIHVSTKEAFSNIQPSPSNINYDNIFNDFNSFLNNKEQVINDFEKYVIGIFPEIKSIKDLMLDKGALFSMMSGSGSTVYGIFEKEEELQEVRTKLPSNYLIFTNLPN